MLSWQNALRSLKAQLFSAFAVKLEPICYSISARVSAKPPRYRMLFHKMRMQRSNLPRLHQVKGYIRPVVIDGATGVISLTRPKRCNGSPSCLFCLSLEYCTTKPSGCMDPKHWMNSAWTDHFRQNAPWKFWLVTTKFYFFMLLIIQWANEWVTNLGRELLSQLENDPPKFTNRKNSNLTTLEWFFLELLRTEGELGWACWWRCPHWGTRHTPFFCRCVQWIEEEPGKCQYFCIFLLDTKGWDILSC